uniref:Secreted protein n=1 Tax=Neogobius melanostomus TaxID=47308 RepID=A0A8C6WRY3_9GOBI
MFFFATYQSLLVILPSLLFLKCRTMRRSPHTSYAHLLPPELLSTNENVQKGKRCEMLVRTVPAGPKFMGTCPHQSLKQY